MRRHGEEYYKAFVISHPFDLRFWNWG